jgi:hypothetical protein
MFWFKVGSRHKSVTYFFLYLYITIQQFKRLYINEVNNQHTRNSK